MINEYQLSQILYNDKNNMKKMNKMNKIKSLKTFFGSPLKKFISNIYNQFEIPKESFYISLFYIKKFYKKNYLNEKILENFFNNINYFIFSSIVLSIKILLDDHINIRDMCNILDLNFDKCIHCEIELLKGLNWEVMYDTNEYYDFKMWLVHYKDFFQQNY